MHIVLNTNIDIYKGRFSTKHTVVPRRGESVRVHDAHVAEMRERNLPIKLRVLDVIHTHDKVLVELHYSQSDIAIAKIVKTNLFP
jgi:hypothetical protein